MLDYFWKAPLSWMIEEKVKIYIASYLINLLLVASRVLCVQTMSRTFHRWKFLRTWRWAGLVKFYSIFHFLQVSPTARHATTPWRVLCVRCVGNRSPEDVSQPCSGSSTQNVLSAGQLRCRKPSTQLWLDFILTFSYLQLLPQTAEQGNIQGAGRQTLLSRVLWQTLRLMMKRSTVKICK